MQAVILSMAGRIKTKLKGVVYDKFGEQHDTGQCVHHLMQPRIAKR